MKLDRALAITRKQFATLRRDKRSLALILVAPVMAMLVFGFAFGTEVSNVPVVVVDQDEGDEAAALIALLDRDALAVRELTLVDEARARVREGEAIAMILFPANFTEGVTPTPGTPPNPGTAGLGATPGTPPGPPPGARIVVFMDSSNAQEAAVVQQALADALRAYAESKGATATIQLETTQAYAADARYLDFFVPGVMGFSALLLTTILTLIAFVGERGSGTLDRLRVTPATETEIVLGYAIAFGAIGAVQGVLLLVAAILVFDILVAGSVVLAAVIIMLLAIDAQAIGILISAAAQREGQAVQMIPFIVLPTMLLSGVFVPTSILPGWLQPVSLLLPPTWAIDALRDVMLRGAGLERVGLDLLVLAGFAALFIALAIVGLRRARA